MRSSNRACFDRLDVPLADYQRRGRFAGSAAARNIGSPLDGPWVRNLAHGDDAAPLRQNAAVLSLGRG
jgi:hypothetical protein